MADAVVGEPITGGSDTRLWHVDRGGRKWVLRVFRPQQRSGLPNEVEAMDLARQAGIPVPEVAAWGVVGETPAMLLSWLDGVPVAQSRKPLRLAEAFGAFHARMHASTRRFDDEDRFWITWADGEGRIQHAIRALPDLEATLIHLDYHPLNVMTDGNEITGVLDWTNATFGDPRADYARTVAVLRLSPMIPRPNPVVSRFERGYRRGYGFSGRAMPLFFAWAGAAMRAEVAHHQRVNGHFFGERDWERIDRWVRSWKRAAGIA
jgi:aminoglycoside phosphotransferase (APT) family kinase protein